MESYLKKIDVRKFFLNIFLPTVLTIGLFILLIFRFIIPYFEQTMLNSKKEMIKELVNSTIGIVTKCENEVKIGLLTEEEAKIKALGLIENLRYGINDKDYFWITDKHPYMLMHPYRPDLNGKDLTDFKDPNGKLMFVAMVYKVKKQNQGYVSYKWQWMDDSDNIVPKISYVKLYKPWGWIIGTGVYIEDVKKEIATIENELTLVSIAISILMTLLLTFIARSNIKTDIKRKQAEEKLKISREKYKALVDASTEGTAMFLEGELIFSNPKFDELLLHSNSPIISDDLHEIIYENRFDDIKLIKQFNQSMEDSLQLETALKYVDNSFINAVISISKITLSEKRGFILVIQELTLNNDGNGVSENLSKDLMDLVDNVSTGVFKFQVGKNIKFIEANLNLLNIFGYTNKDEFLKTDFSDFVDNSDELNQMINDIKKNKIIIDSIIHIRKKDLSQAVLSITARAEFDSEGEMTFASGLMVDITKKYTLDKIKDEIHQQKVSAESFLSLPVASIVQEIISCPMNSTLLQTLKLMQSYKTSVIFLKSENDDIIGYIDNKNIPEILESSKDALNNLVYQYMQSPITYMDGRASISDAISLLQNDNVHFLVIQNALKQIIGLVTNDAIVKTIINKSADLTNVIKNSATIEELKAIFGKLPHLVRNMILSGGSINAITHLITQVSDLITLKLIDIAITEYGEPPVPFAFIALGSEGREEQTLLTDQDNAIIYTNVDDNNKEVIEAYFIKLGTKICDLLNYVGYNYCTGNIMAKNPRWTKPLATWKRYFDEWITTPEPQNLLEAAIFFDFRCIYGNSALVDDLNTHINAKLSANPAFFLHMARVCMNYKTPLGMFGKIQTETKEEHTNSVNIKSPLRVIVNLLRLYSAKHNMNETNSIKRLNCLYEANILNYEFYQDISYAYNYMMELQFKAQTTAYLKDKEMDNYVRLSELSSIELNTLKNIFNHLTYFQNRIKNDFGIKE
jgi:signal-transduction protein with cAMP-binding, CBS, and nucleotidyltransferase domain